MSTTTELGTYGERIAAAYLTDAGLRLLDRNWRCREGEIDLVALDGRTLVIVEVKTRRGTGFGDPLEAVTDDKLTRLCVLAGAWRRAHRQVRAAGTRIDLVGIVVPVRGEPRIDHLEAAA